MVPVNPIGISGETLVVLQVLLTGLNHVKSVPLVFFGMVKVDIELVDIRTNNHSLTVINNTHEILSKSMEVIKN